jgi:hypothetical protein
VSSVVAPSVHQPAHFWLPPSAVKTAGGEAADLAAMVGFAPDAEQRLVLDAMLAEKDDGKWAALEAAVICGRQNLKTAVLQMAALYDLFIREVRLIVWTAHQFRTTSEALRDLVNLIDGSDYLRRRVKKIRTANDAPGIELTSGARLSFLARTGGGGRGLSGDVVILDEALYLTPAMMGALMPTLSAKPDPQVRYGSSAGLMSSDVLRSIRDRGRAGGDPSLVYVEWSTEPGSCSLPMCDHRVGTSGCALDDESLWVAANPAIGRRIDIDYLRAERRALPPLEYARERLGWWEEPPTIGSQSVIPPDDWAARADAASQVDVEQRLTFGVDIAHGRGSASIVVCGTREDGRPHVEVLPAPAGAVGTEWLRPEIDRLVEQYRPLAVALQGNGAPVSSLLDDLVATHGDVIRPVSGTELGRACGVFHDAATQGGLVHIDQAPLNDAVLHASVRPQSDAWTWDRRRSEVDIAPLCAATAALWAWSVDADEVDPVSQIF